ncbi:MAG: radical SAM protein [Bradymonadales bacterium]|jgi:radical SAM superfamily enzyme YgiQ (UPF0313 family)
MQEVFSIKQRLAREQGYIQRSARHCVALLKPSSYFVGMSSLGFQQIYKIINSCPDFCAQRVFVPDDNSEKQLYLYESLRMASNADIIAISIAYELEIPDLIRCLQRLGLEPLAKDRRPTDPLVLIGGPLSFSNFRTLEEMGDCFILGEGEGIVEQFCEVYREYPNKEAFLQAASQTMPELWIPSKSTEMPACRFVEKSMLPAYSQILTPDTEFSDMFLIEAERGCHRRCTFCVMRRGKNAGMRIVPSEKLLSLVPREVKRVGLVGAAVSDHPQLVEILTQLQARGHQCSLSSLRTDRITPELVDILRASGLRSLTIAADGPSERLRQKLLKDVSEDALRYAAEIAAERNMRVKVYVMIGLPEETDEDIDEFANFMLTQFAGQQVVLGVSPFVSKRHTPLDGLGFAGIKVVESRIKRLRRLLGNRINIGDVSAKWAFIEHALAQGGPEMGRVAIQAVNNGGKFGAWKTAMQDIGKTVA